MRVNLQWQEQLAAEEQTYHPEVLLKAQDHRSGHLTHRLLIGGGENSVSNGPWLYLSLSLSPYMLLAEEIQHYLDLPS